MRKVSLMVVVLLWTLPGFSQALVEGAFAAGEKMLAADIRSVLTSKMAQFVAPITSQTINLLPAFSIDSFNANTLDFSSISNGRGNEFIKYHADFLKNLGSGVSFEGFFLPNVSALQKELISMTKHPTHASQALYDAIHSATQSSSGFLGVKVMQQTGNADVLVLNINNGQWQSFQKFLGGNKTLPNPLAK